MRIKKTSETTPIQAQVVNVDSNSTEDSYSCDYVNNNFAEKGIVLWENPSPTSAFAAQNITLSSSDYDYYILIWCTNNTNTQYLSNVSLKGKGCFLNWGYYSNTMNYFTREISYVNDTTLSILNSAGTESRNDRIVPIKIIGFKL